MEKTLLIVESPTKAKTLDKYLGDEYTVKATKGHIKDLPESRLGVDLNNNFEPDYQIIEGKKKIIEELRKTSLKAHSVLLGSDPDREGEAIAWHVKEELTKDVGEEKPIKRVLFYELTHSGIKKALENPGPLNRALYEAQQARRILDRLVGYLISPILWQKVRPGLSAGRVQSVALRLICERERQIYDFRPEEYWTIEAVFKPKENDLSFKGKLSRCYGKKDFLLKEKSQAEEVMEKLRGKLYVVREVIRKRQKLNPPPPFITSTLQQEASRKFRFSPKRTMQIAQQLYEGIELPEEGPVGLITYMRTDSTRLSEESVELARAFIKEQWGLEYLPSKPNRYKVKSASQDAHEAIRPTDVYKTPESLKPFLTKEQYLLYELIWKRFLACQMKPAEVIRTTVDITPVDNDDFLFRVTGSVVDFSGFRVLYFESTDEDTEEDKEMVIPELQEGENLILLDIKPIQHFTQPPKRYSEASLIKELEENGIGRPSTYATIISTIQERGYVVSKNRVLYPTEMGFIVNDILVKHFPEIVDISFTAQMESKLDEIAKGECSLVDVLRDFYEKLKPMLNRASKEISNLRLEGIPVGLKCPNCGNELFIRWFKQGDPFLGCKSCKFRSSYDRDERGHPRIVNDYNEVKVCEKCGRNMVLKKGSYGNFYLCEGYLECKNKKPVTIGIKCPVEGCEGELVERRSKKGRVFYGCSKFPECSFIVNERPIARECPSCGYSIMAEKKKMIVCLNKACKYKEPLEVEDHE